jgi:hypothetical protein
MVLIVFFLFPLALQPNSGLGHLHETFHFTSVTRSRTVGRNPWTGDQLITRPLPVHKHRKMHPPPQERAPSTHWILGWVNPKAGLDNLEKRKFLTLSGLELRPLGHPARSQVLYRLHYYSSNKNAVANGFCSENSTKHINSLLSRMKHI